MPECYLPPTLWSHRYDSSFYTVDLPSYKVEGNVVYYAVQSRIEKNSTIVYRRYSEFETFWKVLHHETTLKGKSPLPNKERCRRYIGWFWSWHIDPSFIEQRRDELQQALQNVLEEPQVATCVCLATFLGWNDKEK